MSQPQGRFAVAITVDDKTDKGAKSAEKRVGQIPKRAGAVNKYQAKATQDAMARSSRGMIRTIGQVEQAGARIFGGRSVTSGFASRIGAIGEAASAAGEGFGAAATSGSALSGAIGVVGVAAGATIGILAAAGYAAFKLVDGWSKGASQIGRTAATIGVATDALQKFTAASERAGVDKGTATGALGGLSQTLNDAVYGRNAGALGVLTKLGIKLERNPDGTANVEAMLPKIADAIARQNSSGRRTAANALGIGEAALPVFTQGGAALSAEMSDAEKTAYIASPGDIARAQRIYRKGAIVGQIKDRGVGEAGSAAAAAAEPGYDMAISAAQGIVKGGESFAGVVKSSFAPAAAKIEKGGAAIDHAATQIVAGLTKQVIAATQAANTRWHIPASVQLAQYGVESGWGRHMPKGSNNPFGIKARPGEPFVMSPTTEVINGKAIRVMGKFRAYASLDEAIDDHARLLAQGRYNRKFRDALPDVNQAVDQLGGGTRDDPRYATDPLYGEKLRRVMDAKQLRQFDHIPVKVEIEMKNAPAGTRAKVTAGTGASPAVSHALAQ
jgi:hypothetical protein